MDWTRTSKKVQTRSVSLPLLSSPMATLKPFNFSIVLPFLFLLIAFQYQLSSLKSHLHQLNSRLSLLESSIQKSFLELSSKEDGATRVEKMVFENEITNLKNMIDSIHKQGSVDANWQMNAQHSPVGGLEKQVRGACIAFMEWIPTLKNPLLTFISTFQPPFHFLTAKATEAYHVSKNASKSLVVKLLKSGVPFIQKSYESVKPYIDQIAPVAKILIMSLGTLLKKMGIFFVNQLVKAINDFINWCLEVAAA